MTSAALPSVATGTVPSAAGDGSRIAPTSALISFSTAATGLLSYGASLFMAHVLDAVEFSVFAAGQMLLNIASVAAFALVPLPLIHAVAANARGSQARTHGMSFAWFVTAGAGCVAALVTGAVAASFAPPPAVLATAVAAFALFFVAPVGGWLQGELRFVPFAAASAAEVCIRIAFGVAAVLLGWGAGAALTGFTVAAVVVVGGALVGGLRKEFAWRPQALRERWRWAETGDMVPTQLAVAVLIGTDVVLVTLLAGGSPDAAGFQALSTLAKGPVYVAAGIVVVAFPLLRSGSDRAEEILTGTLRSFAILTFLASAVLATVPPDLVLLVLPERYAAAIALLPLLAVASFGYALLDLLGNLLLAVGQTRRSQFGLLVAVLVLPTATVGGWRWGGGVAGLAVGTTIGTLVATAVMCVIAAPVLPPSTPRRVVRAAPAALAVLGLLYLVRPLPVLWLVVVGVLGAVLVRELARRPDPDGPAGVGSASPGPLRILHLGFEDPMMPGAGGGSVRTHEINRRLARVDHVTVLVQTYPGAVDRVQDGVRYVPVGLGSGRNRLTRLLGYVVVLPFAVRAHRRADLVVEEFLAPFSSMAVPLWVRLPVVGMVQWLHARDKARQYKLPFHLVERAAVRTHRHLIAVSSGTTERLRTMNPDARIDVIGNGVDAALFDLPAALGTDVLFVGRLELHCKGVDLLLEAWAAASRTLDGRLVIAGTGPDERRIRRLAERLDVADRVEFAGWASGDRKRRLLTGARLVVVPSRHETFGIVAVEALAAATPVVAFDIPCLREVVPTACGWRVPAFDVDALAARLVELYPDADRLRAAGAAGRRFAAGYDWDVLAAEQARVYRERLRATTAASGAASGGVSG